MRDDVVSSASKPALWSALSLPDPRLRIIWARRSELPMESTLPSSIQSKIELSLAFNASRKERL